MPSNKQSCNLSIRAPTAKSLFLLIYPIIDIPFGTLIEPFIRCSSEGKINSSLELVTKVFKYMLSFIISSTLRSLLVVTQK